MAFSDFGFRISDFEFRISNFEPDGWKQEEVATDFRPGNRSRASRHQPGVDRNGTEEVATRFLPQKSGSERRGVSPTWLSRNRGGVNPVFRHWKPGFLTPHGSVSEAETGSEGSGYIL